MSPVPTNEVRAQRQRRGAAAARRQRTTGGARGHAVRPPAISFNFLFDLYGRVAG